MALPLENYFSKLNEFHKFLILCLICIICYHNCLVCEFAFDDKTAISDNKDLKPSTPIKNLLFNDFWGTPLNNERSHKSYRPITVLTFRLNYLIHELNPIGYHLINLILHILVCFLYYRIIKIFLREDISFLASILFSVHPIHTEAVTGVVGRAELLSSIFYLWTLGLYHNISKTYNYFKYLLIFITLLCAMFSKEQGITMSGICLIYECFIVQENNPIDIMKKFFNFLKNKTDVTKKIKLTTNGLVRISIIIGYTIFLIYLRVYVMGSKLPVFTKFDNPASTEKFPTKQLTLSYLVYVNVKLLLFPCNLCCDWTMGTIPIINGVYDTRNIATTLSFLTILCFIFSCFHRNSFHTKILIMGLSMMILPYLPASNLFFPVGFVIAERVLYMPSMGFCILVSYGHSIIKKKHLYISTVFIIFLVFSHGFRTYHRNNDWKTEYTIFLSGLQVNHNNAKLWNNVGHALEHDGKFSEALAYFIKATEVEKNDIGAFINVGRTYKSLEMFKEAESFYNKARSLLPKPKKGESYHTRIAPHYLSVFLSLSKLISMDNSRLEEADLLLQSAISMRADYVQAYINRGDILMKLNRTEDAKKVYLEALTYENDNSDVYYNLGVVFLNQEKAEESLRYFEKAIELNPEHELALLNSAILLQEMNINLDTSRNRFFKLLKKNDKNEKVLFNLGMMAMDENKIVEAIGYFKRAIEIKNDFRSALFNLALLLSDNKRSLEAISYLKKLVHHHPNHSKGLILLGDIYINELKDLDSAEKCYTQILHHDPNNVQALHNRCVVYVEKGRLNEALKCLEKAHKIAPNEDYILKHLNIVKSKMKINT